MQNIEKFDIATSVTDSLIDMFDVMLSMNLELADEELAASLSTDRIVGSVSLAGRVVGGIIFQVTKNFSHQMTAAMLGLDKDETPGEEDVKDVVREMCNIVGGNLKSKFCDAGLTCELSPPSFTTGTDFTIESLNISRHERYVFSFEQNPVVVEVGVRVSEDSDLTVTALGESDEQQATININEMRNFDVKTSIQGSMTDLFDTMLSMELATSEEDLSPRLVGQRIVGGINFVGLLMGSLNIYITEEMARLMTAAMLGIDIDEVEGEQDVKDVINELCNIVGGSLKSKLCDAGLTCNLSSPFFTSGTDFIIDSQMVMRYDRYSFSCQDQIIIVEVGFKGSEEASAENGENSVNEAEIQSANEPILSQDDIDAMIKAGENTNNEIEPPDALEPEQNDDMQPITQESADAAAPPEEPQTKSEKDEIQASNMHNFFGKAIAEKDLGFILDIPLEISVELGRTVIPINELLQLDSGSIVELLNLKDEPLNILAKNKVVARGNLEVVNEKYAIRITEIVGSKK